MSLKQRVWPGAPFPLGAMWDGRGVNFALFAENAEKIELCLFDERGEKELERIVMPEYTNEVWHAYLPDVRPGQLYGYRVYGMYAPQQGHRFNHHKLLIDPYARALVGRFEWSNSHFAYDLSSPDGDLSFDMHDNASFLPKCEVVDTAFTWGDDRQPNTPWSDTIIYELHVRGMTRLHPDVPAALRGTFRGLSSPVIIDHLRALGITAVELMPIHEFIDDHHLVEQGLQNYWGYNSISFFAPEARYLSSRDYREFKTLVHLFHEAGIEVILDVVYNHTGEGNHLGPTLSFRGIDNAAYYRLKKHEPRYYEEFTGCGNALNLHHPRVLQLVMDSLRYWVNEMHVDGFRFDLTTTLAREADGSFNTHAGFLDALCQDPDLSKVKLIAEPWDVGPNGYQLGHFRGVLAEWNDRYRDTVRQFWKSDDGQVGKMASRITGSQDLFHGRSRRPWSSINFVTAHDGFTLEDLVSYEKKNNEANGENNRDGTDHNYSWNCGVEGPSTDPQILALRDQQKRNFMATLLLSQGTPMLLAGDELSHSQHGSNNAYCQDNMTSWLDWEHIDERGRAFFRFVQRVIQIRKQHIVFRRRHFFRGEPVLGTNIKDITWIHPSGVEMTQTHWNEAHAKTFGFILSGVAGRSHRTAQGVPETDHPFFAVCNADHAAVDFRIPTENFGRAWVPVLDTTQPEGVGEPLLLHPSDLWRSPARSLFLFRGIDYNNESEDLFE